MRGSTVLLFSLWTLLSGCEEQVYPCQSDDNCVLLGVQGICLSAGHASYCAFPEAQCTPGPITYPNNSGSCCTSGWRWDESAPAIIQNDCVNVSVVQAHDKLSTDLAPVSPHDGGAD